MMAYKYLLVQLFVIFSLMLCGCSIALEKLYVKEEQMSIWITPEYAPESIAHYPYIKVPVRSGITVNASQVAES